MFSFLTSGELLGGLTKEKAVPSDSHVEGAENWEE